MPGRYATYARPLCAIFSWYYETEFYTRKIKHLSDGRLKELLQLRNKENLDIMTIAENEAVRRGIDLRTIETEIKQAKTPGRNQRRKKVSVGQVFLRIYFQDYHDQKRSWKSDYNKKVKSLLGLV